MCGASLPSAGHAAASSGTLSADTWLLCALNAMQKSVFLNITVRISPVYRVWVQMTQTSLAWLSWPAFQKIKWNKAENILAAFVVGRFDLSHGRIRKTVSEFAKPAVEQGCTEILLNIQTRAFQMAMIPLFDLITSSNNIGYFCMCTSCLYLTSENTNYLSKYREMDEKKTTLGCQMF